MKRFATAAAAATLSLSLVAGPAFTGAANKQLSDKDAKVGSSVAYAQCKARAEAAEKQKEADAKKKAADAKTAGDLAKNKADQARQEAREELTSASDELDCVKELINDKDYKAGILGLLIGVPAAIIALLGVAGAAVAGVIPGVQLPALPF
ncbi:hypothetical protein [Corynebacterium sp. NML130628]|uniref:hypothetical protein n=1 Tax=Corynebacterium sp. NML130628 TaxID=1906333 RepID=UPI0008FADD18|nr:hypothetical protein [Corynebacterium sp. NML130628]OIR43683.1 hypothetical protein BJP07_06810 [Corynebacterium sp. NML130628]